MTSPRRPRLFAFSPEVELAGVAGWASPLELEVLTALTEAFVEVTRTRKLTAGRLAPVVAAAVHASENVRAVGVARLVVLAHYFEHARAAYRELALHEDPQVRLTAAAGLPNAPEASIESLLEVYLVDEVAAVRRTAARVLAAAPTEPLRALAARVLPAEPDSEVRATLEPIVDAPLGSP